MIVIDSDDEYEDDEMLARFMRLDLDSKMDTFRDSLVSLMQQPLEGRHACG